MFVPFEILTRLPRALARARARILAPHRGGWFFNGETSRDSEAIVTLLRPDGQLFRLLIEKGADLLCEFPVDKLPVRKLAITACFLAKMILFCHRHDRAVTDTTMHCHGRLSLVAAVFATQTEANAWQSTDFNDSSLCVFNKYINNTFKFR